MPKACSNCRRFHFGKCRDEANICQSCGGTNHIATYCPDRNGFIKPTSGEPLAGTRAWCKKYGLDEDRKLRHQVLQTLKRFPASAIWIKDGNKDVCIYAGNDSFFEREETMKIRGRSSRRDRSRSPEEQRGRQRFRSRSPIRRHDRYPSPILRYEADEREALPRYGLGDRSPSPLPRGRSPVKYAWFGPVQRGTSAWSRNASVYYREELDQFNAPEYPREPEPRSTLYGSMYHSYQP